MDTTVLILGPTGRLGRTAALAFEQAGWEVRRFDRLKDTLWDAAWGASVIVNGWNPTYDKWAADVPRQTAQIIEVAQASGATVIIPGNVYVYGAQAPDLFTPDTPHLARNPLGRVRVAMEAAYRASGVQTLVVRAGDYIDTQASGNWFDLVIARKARRGVVYYPGPLDVPHAFTYLPDVAATMVALAAKRRQLGQVEDVNVPSVTLTGRRLADGIGACLGRDMIARTMPWWPLRLAAPVWPVGRGMVEMRYLWAKPHRLDTTRHTVLCPEVRQTPLDRALGRALQHQVNPDEAMGASGLPVVPE